MAPLHAEEGDGEGVAVVVEGITVVVGASVVAALVEEVVVVGARVVVEAPFQTIKFGRARIARFAPQCGSHVATLPIFALGAYVTTIDRKSVV